MRRRALCLAAFVASLFLVSAFGSNVHAQVSGTGPSGGTAATTVRTEPGSPAASGPQIRPNAILAGSPVVMNWRNVSLLRSNPVLAQLWRRGLLR